MRGEKSAWMTSLGLCALFELSWILFGLKVTLLYPSLISK
jgi:hypothetical protein